MSVKRMLIVALAFLLAGCGVPTPEAPSMEAMATRVAATLSALTPIAHGITEPPPTATVPESTLLPTAAPPVLRIAFINGGNIWLAEGDTPAVQLTSSGSAEQVWISSDGQQVVFTRRPSVDGPVEVRVVHRDGSGEAVLVSTEGWNDLYSHEGFLFNDLQQMDFIPGTHRLLLNTRGVPEGPGLARYNDLLRLDADSGALTSLRAPGSGGTFQISPDGLKAVVAQHDRLSLFTVDGGVIRADAITFTPVITYSEYQYHPVGQWAPDSSAVGFAIPSEDPLAPDASASIWRLPADGGPAANLATIAGGFFFTQFNAPSISPDLAWVSFQRDTTTTNVRNMLLARSDGRGETIVATGQLFWDGWAPDSTHFVFGLDAPMSLQLGTLGASPVPLTSGTQLRWIDTTTYIYLSGGSGAWSVMRGTLGGPPVAIASPAGDFVAYDVAY
jgi:hypothetical protein